jgi:hypothetical protein
MFLILAVTLGFLVATHFGFVRRLRTIGKSNSAVRSLSSVASAPLPVLRRSFWQRELTTAAQKITS